MWIGLLLAWFGSCLAGPASDSSIIHFPDGAEQVRDKKDVVGLSRMRDAGFIQSSQIRNAGFIQSSRITDAGFIQPCPNNQDFCEHIEDYPTHIKVSPAASVNEFVKDKLFDKPKPPLAPNQRSNFVEESQACRHRRSVVYPKKAKNTNGVFMFIVNKAEYRQAVDIEQCEGEGRPCETDGDAPQMNVGSTVCRQKFTTYKLYAIDHEGDQVYDSFSLPSACLCYHKSSFSVRVGLAASNDPSTKSSLPFCPSENQKESFDNTVNVVAVASKPSRVTFIEKIRNNRRTRQQQRRHSLKPKACKRGMFCEENRDYPRNAIASALKQDRQLSEKLFQEVFNSECAEPRINPRFSPTEEALCDSRPRVVYPKKALNLEDKWMFVVNLENYTQSVEIEECVDQRNRRQFGAVQNKENKYGVCLYGGAEGHNPDLTVCRQKYTEHKLLAFTADSELLVDTFKLPSTCACFVKSDFLFDFEIRVGLENTHPETTKSVLFFE